jgi:hypothetical protein
LSAGDILPLVMLALLGGVGAFLLFVLADVRDAMRDLSALEQAWGDQPAIPEEAKARGGKSLGERAEKAARAQRRTGHIAHDKRASTR